MTTVHKYTLKVEDRQTVQMPEFARILSVGVQRENVCIWAQVDPSMRLVPRDIEVFGTGHPMSEPGVGREFLGTVQLQGGSLVFHVFERNPIKF